MASGPSELERSRRTKSPRMSFCHFTGSASSGILLPRSVRAQMISALQERQLLTRPSPAPVRASSGTGRKRAPTLRPVRCLPLYGAGRTLPSAEASVRALPDPRSHWNLLPQATERRRARPGSVASSSPSLVAVASTTGDEDLNHGRPVIGCPVAAQVLAAVLLLERHVHLQATPVRSARVGPASLVAVNAHPRAEIVRSRLESARHLLPVDPEIVDPPEERRARSPSFHVR